MDVKFDAILQKMREADDEGGRGSGATGEYTSFEVLANDVEIPAGTTEYLGANLAVDGVGTAVAIPVGMEHACKVWVVSGDGVTVDWGDGTTEKIFAVDSIALCDHLYTAPGKYTVKVYGDFVRIVQVYGANLVHRVFDEGLPLAAHHASMQEFASAKNPAPPYDYDGALRLVEVAAPSWGKCTQIESLLNTFTGCENLRRVSGMARIPHLVSASGAFKDCHNLASCDFRLPPVILNVPGTGDAYRGVFYSSTNVGFALSGEVSKFFPDGGFAADFVDLTQLFYNFRADLRYPNMTLSDANAEKLARILWLSGKRFVYRSASDETGGTSGIFRCFPADVRAKIPVLWGGTNTDIEIDPATGCVPKAANGVQFNEGTFSLAADLFTTINAKYVNVGGGSGNVHPDFSLVVGSNTVTAQATNSVVCGGSNECSNSYSFMFGYQLKSSPPMQFQTVVGRSNQQDADAYFIVGNGMSSTVRSNAFVVKKNGDGVFGGDVLCGGTVSMLNLLARIEALEARLAE
ncbi:MAG: hypothetical protein MJ016_02170 [Victivallaceae bacterium]|nr:hypothetical protein [Victivallaceae bacterium]